MNTGWERRRILIWGKTRPELSKTYREIVCTGGVLADTKRLIRLYPIPLRLMNEERVFKKYQWIEAPIVKASQDPRPESYRINYDAITVGEVIPPQPGNWQQRAQWIMDENNIFSSIEDIQQKQQEDGTSLGIIQPNVIRVTSERVSEDERQRYWDDYTATLAQMALDMDRENDEVKPLRPPEFRFKVKFRCNDKRCNIEHDFSIRDWEVDALYFNSRTGGRSQTEAAQVVVDKLANDVCAGDKDTRFFVGNIHNYPQTFTIVGLWYPKRLEVHQPALL
ncbi:MAG: hypothetical protein HZB53_08620 [Chloroflexi bacterium]|nr:hypothetical protein [Chloroflexota bacterium]